MKKGILWLLVSLFAIHAKAQQDTQVSQYIFNGIYVNPAYAGYKDEVYIQSFFRSQWVGITGAPTSFAVAIDGSVNDGRVGLGAILSNDKIGAQSQMTGYLTYAYRLRVGEDETSHLSFGISAGMLQLGLDGAKLNAVQPGDQAVPVASQSMIIPDANFGVYYANANYFAGVSSTNVLASFVHHNGTQNLLVPIPQPHFYLTAGTLIPVNDDVMVKPVFLIKDDVKGPTTLDVDGFILLNQRINFGAFYRSSIKLYNKSNLQTDLPKQNAFGGIVEFFATPSIRIGYSYDHSLNALGSYNYGSHEFSIGFYLNSRSGSDKSSGFRCYKF